jgi:hypothetical protein
MMNLLKAFRNRLGSVCIRFQGPDDEGNQVRAQRFAAGLIRAMLDEIDTQLATTSDEASIGQAVSAPSA